MSRSLTPFITIILLLFSIFSGRAQSVGVVMSGGGAKGLYHIGVLQALEERGVPIDYVAGTSMGSIIAGLYAAGYSPSQMREIAESGDMERWITGRIDQSYGAFYRQYRQVPSLFSLRLDTKNFKPLSEDGRKRFRHQTEEQESINSDYSSSETEGERPSLYMPGSIISSTQIDLELNRLFAPASESVGGDFDRLMVPFLCVASDIKGRREVVLTKGDLGLSIRASMAIPIAFESVNIGDAILYDGGIYDNFPWRQLLARHNPDVLIGSICTAGNTVIDAQSSMVEQVFALTTNDSDYDLPEGSITIQRDAPVGMLDFSNAKPIIDMGYDDTIAKIDSIEQRITVRRDSTYYDERRREFLAGVKPLIFDSYNINGLTKQQEAYVQDFLHTSSNPRNVLQREMPYDELKENLFRVLSGGDFSTSYPTVKYNPMSEKYSFDVNLETKPQLKLSLGGHLSSTAFNQLFLSLNYKSVKRVAQSYFADLYLGTIATSAMIGGRTDFYIKQPLFLDYYFNYSSKNLEYGSLGNLTDVTNIERVRTNDTHFSVAGGLPITRRSMFSLRLNSGWSNYYYDPAPVGSTDVEASELYDRTRLGFVGAKAEMQRSTLNRAVYPQSGSKLAISAIGVYGRERNYQTMFSRATATPAVSNSWWGARVKYQKYFEPPFESWFSLGLDVDAVYTNLKQIGNPTANLLMMPSYQPVPQSRLVYMPDYSAKAFIGVGLIPIFKVMPNMLLRTGIYGMYRDGGGYITGLDSGVISPSSLQYIAESTLVYHSSIGPVSLSLTKFDLRSWNNLYLTIGFGFPIFSPKGTFY